MKPRGKRLRAITEAPPPARTLPGDLVLEIAAWADAATLVRFAASCKPLRRDILNPDFVRRFRVTPTACLLGFLHAYDHMVLAIRPSALFSLIQPTTPAAASLSGTRIVPRLSRGALDDFLGRYVPLSSRHGLLVLRRRHIKRRGSRDICVFDPFTGDRSFFSPPDIKRDFSYTYTLLTAADGVGSSFLLVAADFMNLGRSCSIKIQTVSSANSDREWGPVAVSNHPLQKMSYLSPWGGVVVLGSLIHWLMYATDKGSLILTYNVGTTTAGSIELPADVLPEGQILLNHHLTSSSDGRLILLAADGYTVSIWHLLSTGDGWEQQASIDISPLVPDLTQRWQELHRRIKFVGGTGGRSGAVLLRPSTIDYRLLNGENRIFLLDMETKEMRRISNQDYTGSSFPYEVDLASRLSVMKIF
ncbi:hypothetical protein EJB05_16394, partial [Eragrostis curvula]